MADADVFIAKADESMASADDDLEGGRYNACARNSYFAAFQAGVAALMNEGILPTGDWTHNFVDSRFSGILVNRRKTFRKEHARAIDENRKLRVRADYSVNHVSRRASERSLDRAREMVRAVRSRIDGDS